MPIHFRSRPALIAYFTCGDPSLNVTREVILAAANAGADAIELGVPFSDPVADGPVIQRASERALRNHVCLADVIDLARSVREKSDVGLIVFSYLNPILQFGVTKFCAAAADAGIDGALITDLPVEEAQAYLKAMRSRALDTIFLAAPTSTDERLKRIAACSNGFVYAVSRTGVTGEREQAPQDARELVRRLRKYTKLPIAVGFGISNPEQFASVGQFADAVVVGSALVRTIEQNPGKEARSVADFVSRLKGQTPEQRLPSFPREK